jgi:hypothetical protein
MQLLDQGDSDAIDLCEQNEDLLRTAYPNQWRKISDRVNSFDFEAALVLLQEAM